jgi:hypothetical protein
VAGIPWTNWGARIGRFGRWDRPLEGPVTALMYVHEHIDIEYEVFCLGKTESWVNRQFLTLQRYMPLLI